MSVPRRSAVLLIDVQESFVHRPSWVEAARAPFLAQVHALLQGAQAQGLPVLRILHHDGPAEPDNPFALESGLVRPLQGLMAFHAAAEFLKQRHSALVGTGLAVWLHRQGIARLLIAGIRTEQCCETTARHASDEGWEVDFVSPATLTFDMTSPDGRPLSAAAMVQRTEAALHGRFATVCDVDQALARAAAAGAWPALPAAA